MYLLQRSYAVTSERIQTMLSKGSSSALYDPTKVAELENAEELTGKELKKLENYQNNKSNYDSIIEALKNAVSDVVYLSLTEFMPVLTKILSGTQADKKLIDKIAEGLSVMDKSAEIQHDKKGNIIYDKKTKNTEIVKFDEIIWNYMAREVLPRVSDAQWFFEENLSKKTPVIKTGAEIPFTRYFYKYQKPKSSEELKQYFVIANLQIILMIAGSVVGTTILCVLVVTTMRLVKKHRTVNGNA